MTETHVTPSGFKNRSDLHIARKVWHVLAVFFVFMCWNLIPHPIGRWLLAIFWILFIAVDIVRQKNIDFNRQITKMLRPIMRSTEINRLAGTSYLLTGVLLTTLLFNPAVVSLSLLFLAFADPIASFIGIKYGKDKIFGHKSAQGFIAAFVVCAIITAIFLTFNHVNEYILVVSLLSGLVGALSELIPIAKLDDNFTMPVLSSVGLTILFYFFGFSSYFN